MAATPATEALRATRSGPLLAALAVDQPDLADRVGAIAEAVLLDLTAPQAPLPTKREDTPATGAALPVPVPMVPPFAIVRDVACLTPRGKHDVEFTGAS